MNNLLKNALLGVVAGAAVGVVLAVVEENPKLPSALKALGNKLLPLATIIAAELMNDEADEDTDEPAADAAAPAAATDPSAPQHPQGPDFAPTPE